LTPTHQTPNIDGLAARKGATLFSSAYVQVQFAHCVVSRASILSGRRPAHTRAKTGNPFGYGGCARGAGNFTTLPTLLREAGWATAGSGKVFHPDTCDGAAVGEDRYAWTQPYFHGPCFQWDSLPCRSQHSKGAGCGIDSWVANATAADIDVPDGMIAASAVAQMRQLAGGAAPWFVAVGLHKPHLPHVAPKKYFDLYSDTAVPGATPRHVPTGSAPVVWESEGGTHELWEYDDMIAKYGSDYWSNATSMGELPGSEVRAQRVACAACVSFTDAQVNKFFKNMCNEFNVVLPDALVGSGFGCGGWGWERASSSSLFPPLR